MGGGVFNQSINSLMRLRAPPSLTPTIRPVHPRIRNSPFSRARMRVLFCRKTGCVVRPRFMRVCVCARQSPPALRPTVPHRVDVIVVPLAAYIIVFVAMPACAQMCVRVPNVWKLMLMAMFCVVHVNRANALVVRVRVYACMRVCA